MAAPHKGPRRGFQLRWTDDERRLVRARADAAGMTMTEYLVALVHRDEVDPVGCPVWADGATPTDQLPMVLTG